MVRVTALKLEIPGSDPGFDNFFFFFFFAHANLVSYFFCANSTHTSTHASNLRKFANPYNARKFDAQSAHVARLRRYCAE